MVDADILRTLLLLLDHSSSAVQTNAEWALMVRGGRGREKGRGGEGRRKGGEGRVPSASYLPVQCRSMQHGHSCDVQWTTLCTKSQLPVLMNVVNNVHCFGSSVEPVTPRYRANPPTAFRELNNTTPYKVRQLLVYTRCRLYMCMCMGGFVCSSLYVVANFCITCAYVHDMHLDTL